MPNIIIHSNHLAPSAAERIAAAFNATVNSHGNYHVLQSAAPIDETRIDALRHELRLDINVVPDGFQSSAIRLLITDMDSTLINIECVDEIADFAGKKPEVAAITEAAMRGELDFNASLTRRVALLQGLGTEVLNEVYERRLRLNPGAEALLQGLKLRGIKTALVSGGFTFFTDKLCKRLGFDFVLSNVLDIADGRLTGRINGAIVNADGKAGFLQQLCERLSVSTRASIAMGDGANDLKMLRLSGLSVAYRAKPAVQKEAQVKINYCGLDAVLHILDFAQ